MSLELICDKCGRPLKADGYLPGSRVRCPRCGGGAQVPAAPVPAHETPVDGPLPAGKRPSAPEATARPAKKKKKPVPAATPSSAGSARAAAEHDEALAPVGFGPSSLDDLGALNAAAFATAPAGWGFDSAPRRSRIDKRTLQMMIAAGVGVGLLVMVMLVVIGMRSAVRTGPSTDLATVQDDPGGKSPPPGANSPKDPRTPIGPNPNPPAKNDDHPSQPPVTGDGPKIKPQEPAYLLVGVWEQKRSGQVVESMELRDDGTLLWSTLKFDGMSPPHAGRWKVQTVFDDEFVLAINHASLGGDLVAKVELLPPDRTRWKFPGRAGAVDFQKRSSGAPVATSPPRTRPENSGDDDDSPNPTPRLETPEDWPPARDRLTGIWDLTNAGRYKSSMLSFDQDGTFDLLVNKGGAATHSGGTWKLIEEDGEQLTLRLGLTKVKGSGAAPIPGDSKTPRDGGAEIVVRFTARDEMKIDFRLFRLEGSGDYFRRGTELPQITARPADHGDDAGRDDEDEPAIKAERWQVVHAYVLPHTFERKKASGKTKAAGTSVSHHGCSCLHVTLEYLRGEFAPELKGVRLVDEQGRLVGYVSWIDRVDKEPKQMLVVFERLGDFTPGDAYYLEDHGRLTRVW